MGRNAHGMPEAHRVGPGAGLSVGGISSRGHVARELRRVTRGELTRESHKLNLDSLRCARGVRALNCRMCGGKTSHRTPGVE